MRETFVQASYFIASILFILGLKGLSKADTALRGVNYAAVGMLVALAAVDFVPQRKRLQVK